MGEDPAAIREEIEQTRERMGDTVDALGYKADVPSRAKDSINDKVQGAKAKITGTGSQVSDATPGTEDVKQAGKQAVGIAQENPLGLAIGAAAVGFLAGMLIPSTKLEDERLGPVADQVKEQSRPARRRSSTASRSPRTPRRSPPRKPRRPPQRSKTRRSKQLSSTPRS